MIKKTFAEYMNSKGVTVEKPVVDAKGDPKVTTSDKPDQGKNSKPYAAGKNSDKYKPKKPADGFADKGNSKLKYAPGVAGVDKAGEGGKKVASFPNCKSATTKSEAFLDATKGMNSSEFAKFVAEQNKAGRSDVSHPSQYIKYTTALVAENANLADSLVCEFRRRGVLALLAFEVLSQPEGVKTLVEMMGDPVIGPAFCRKLARKMSEEVSPPVTQDMEDEEGQDIPTDPMNAEVPDQAGEEDAPVDPNAPPEEEGEPDEEGEFDLDAHHPDPHGLTASPPGMPSPVPGVAPPGGAVENVLNALAGHAKMFEGMYHTVAKRVRR